MFFAQIIGTLWSCVVQIAVMEWAFGNIQDICKTGQANNFTCPNGRVFFNASIIFGLSKITASLLFHCSGIHAARLLLYNTTQSISMLTPHSSQLVRSVYSPLGQFMVAYNGSGSRVLSRHFSYTLAQEHSHALKLDFLVLRYSLADCSSCLQPHPYHIYLGVWSDLCSKRSFGIDTVDGGCGLTILPVLAWMLDLRFALLLSSLLWILRPLRSQL